MNTYAAAVVWSVLFLSASSKFFNNVFQFHCLRICDANERFLLLKLHLWLAHTVSYSWSTLLQNQHTFFQILACVFWKPSLRIFKFSIGANPKLANAFVFLLLIIHFSWLRPPWDSELQMVRYQVSLPYTWSPEFEHKEVERLYWQNGKHWFWHLLFIKVYILRLMLRTPLLIEEFE